MSDSTTSTGPLRAAAVATLLLGVLLLLGSWDGVYDALELPQARPALGAQVGGAALVGLAYLLWAASTRPELAGVAAMAGAISLGGGALVIAGWVIFRDEADLGVDDAGIVVLIVAAVVLGVLGLALARAALRSR